MKCLHKATYISVNPVRLLCFMLLVVTIASAPVGAWADEGGETEDGEPDAGHALPEIVVTASKAEQDPFRAPQYVSVITGEEIDEKIPSTTPDLLTGEPGVLVQKTNLGGGSPFIRGLTGKQILLLVDGVRLNTSLTRYGPHQYLNTIDPGQIERIEIVRGPMSVLYGSDAMGGTINVITKKREDLDPGFDWGGIAYGQYGSAAHERTGRLRFEGNLGSFGFTTGASYRGFSDLTGGRGIGLQEPTGYEEVDADGKFNFRIGTDHEIIVATQFVRQFHVPKTSEVTLGGKEKYDYEPQIRHLTYLRYEGRNIAGRWLDLARATVSYSLQEEGEEVIEKYHFDEKDLVFETREHNEAKTLGVTLHLRSDLGPYSLLSYGVEFYHDWIGSRKEYREDTQPFTQVRSAFPDGAVYSSFGAYLQDEIRLFGPLSLVVGGRYSRVDTEGELADPSTLGGTQTLSLETDNFSGMAHLRIDLLDSTAVVLGVAQGFRAPNMEDFFGKVDFSSEIPNTDLEPESSVNYEAGLKLKMSRLTGNLFYYFSEYEDLIDRVEVQDDDVESSCQRRNVGRARIQGVEMDALLALTDRLSLSGTFSWTRGEDLTSDEPLRRIPPAHGSLAVRYDFRDDLWAEASGLFAARQDRLSQGDKDDPRIPEGGTPSYAVFSLAGGATLFDRLELTLMVENIGNVRYKTHGSGIYGPGTNFMAGCRYNF